MSMYLCIFTFIALFYIYVLMQFILAYIISCGKFMNQNLILIKDDRKIVDSLHVDLKQT